MKNFAIGVMICGALVSNYVWQTSDSGAALVVSGIFIFIAILLLLVPFPEQLKIKVKVRR